MKGYVTTIVEMKDVKITVLERTSVERLIKEYGNPTLEHFCPFNKEGQEYVSIEGRKPEGFCEEAWTAFGKYVFALAHGSDGFWPSWIKARHVSINSCNDGLRPVIFKLEVIS